MFLFGTGRAIIYLPKKEETKGSRCFLAISYISSNPKTYHAIEGDYTTPSYYSFLFPLLGTPNAFGKGKQRRVRKINEHRSVREEIERKKGKGNRGSEVWMICSQRR
jgi:hypothetical protein